MSRSHSLLLFLAVGVLAASAPAASVPYERLRHADKEPANWLTYAGNYQSHRFSRLDQINRQNVAGLKVSWIYQIRQPGIIETSPLVADGIMYVTEPPNSTVTAIDVRSGRTIWSYTPDIPRDVIIIGSPPVNRGVALLDDMVYVGTVHGHLIALDAASGIVRWDVAVEDNKKAYYLTLAPLALDGRIIVGVSGAEAGIRGFIDAYDPKTGRLLWRTFTIPAPGEPGSDTWGGDSWKTGGSSTWLTGSYDPELNLLYWTTGNPAPDWNGDTRPGDNLYSCSVLALDPADGKMKWHYQFTPHDTHDWDANQTVILFDAPIDGRPRKLLAQANRNSFYYVLDRETGRFLGATQYAHQTWAERIDENGRPILFPGKDPTYEGNLAYPNIQGAANWHAPSYSPQTGLFYQGTREMGTVYFKGDAVYKPGTGFTGGGGRALSGDDAWSAVRALDRVTGKLKWEYRLLSPGFTSLLSTAGGLVFGGTEEGNLFALDAETGRLLWDMQVGGAVRGIPISYAIDGRQHLVIAAGFTIIVLGL
jgi:alcohol dehydrogenase (cytochrome c)